MKLSFNDKCWVVANIKRVLVPPSAILVFAIFFSAIEVKEELKSSNNIFDFWSILILIIMGVIAIKYAYHIAKFAETNFDQVVSRRTKWKSSNVELHEMKYRFVLETFGWALFSIFIPQFSIVWFMIYIVKF